MRLGIGRGTGYIHTVYDDLHRFEAAGDMYVGRTASGLPLDSAKFSIIGPFFMDIQIGKEAVLLFYPSCPTNLLLVAQHTLASVIYHHDFLSL